MLVVSALLVSLLTACGSSDSNTDEESDGDATLTTVDSPASDATDSAASDSSDATSDDADATDNATATSDDADATDNATATSDDADATDNATATDSSDTTSDDTTATSTGDPDDVVSITPDDLAGDNFGMPVEEDQTPSRDSLVPVIVSGAVSRVMEIDPPQVIIEVSGETTDACQTVWSEWDTNEDGTIYNVKVWGVTPPSDDGSLQCAQVLQPFQEDVFLEGPAEFGGFPPGKYTVIVNDTITLDLDF